MPAWIGVVDGAVTVGLGDERARAVRRAGRRHEGGAARLPGRGREPAALGATTVSATMWAAARAGIEVGATGGIGGVHRGAHPDVSAPTSWSSRARRGCWCASGRSRSSIRPRRRRSSRSSASRSSATGSTGCRSSWRARRRSSWSTEPTARMRRPRWPAPRRISAWPTHDPAVQPGPGCRRDGRRARSATAVAEARGASGASGVHGKARTPFLLRRSPRSRADEPPGEPRPARGQRAGGRTRRGEPGRRLSAARSG